MEVTSRVDTVPHQMQMKETALARAAVKATVKQ